MRQYFRTQLLTLALTTGFVCLSVRPSACLSKVPLKFYFRNRGIKAFSIIQFLLLPITFNINTLSEFIRMHDNSLLKPSMSMTNIKKSTPIVQFFFLFCSSLFVFIAFLDEIRNKEQFATLFWPHTVDIMLFFFSGMRLQSMTMMMTIRQQCITNTTWYERVEKQQSY